MQKYQELVGKIILSLSIIIAAILITISIGNVANALASISNALNNMGSLIRDGLLQLGSAA